MSAAEGGGWVCKMLSMADEGWRVGRSKMKK